jgi:polyisoprenoid-binding protein YceI
MTRTITTLLSLAAVSTLAATLVASQPSNQPSTQATAPAARPAAAVGAAYEVDDVHSAAFFRVQHLGASQFWGRINELSGSFTVDPTGGASGVSFDITVKASTVDTGTDKLDEHLRSPDFFNAKEFPNMTFKSTGAKAVRPNFLEVTGDFTLHGVTKTITAMVEFTGQRAGPMGDRAGYEAIFTIKRSEFGVKYGVENGSLGDEVRIVVSLEGIKKG